MRVAVDPWVRAHIHRPAAGGRPELRAGADAGLGAVVAVRLVVAPAAALDVERPRRRRRVGRGHVVEGVRRAVEAGGRLVAGVLREEGEGRRAGAEADLDGPDGAARSVSEPTMANELRSISVSGPKACSCRNEKQVGVAEEAETS